MARYMWTETPLSVWFSPYVFSCQNSIHAAEIISSSVHEDPPSESVWRRIRNQANFWASPAPIHLFMCCFACAHKHRWKRSCCNEKKENPWCSRCLMGWESTFSLAGLQRNYNVLQQNWALRRAKKGGGKKKKEKIRNAVKKMTQQEMIEW